MPQFSKKRINDVFAPFLNDSYPESFRYAEITDMKVIKQTRELRLSAVCAAHFEKADTLISEFSDALKEKLNLDKVTVNLSVPEKAETAAEATDESDKSELLDKLREMQEAADIKSAEEREKRALEVEEAKPHQVIDGLPLYLETVKMLYGTKIGKKPKNISEILPDDGSVSVWGDVFGLEIKETRDGRKNIVRFNITDGTGAYPIKVLQPKTEVKTLCKKLKNGMTVMVRGDVGYDRFAQDYLIEAKAIASVNRIRRTDDAPKKRVELHMHSNMSALDAMTDAGVLVERAAEWGHSAVALTDHGVLQGYPAAFAAAEKTGIKVIYGVEAYLFDDMREDAPKGWEDILEHLKDKDEHTYHQIILVKNNVGLKNLYKLVSNAHTEHFFYKPITLKSDLIKHREGLILGTACERGELYRAIEDGESEERIKEIVDFYDYLEIQPLGNNAFKLRPSYVKDKVTKIETQVPPRYDSEEALKDINRRILALADAAGKPCVATGDVHFLDPEDAKFRTIIQAGQGYRNPEIQPPIYFKTTEEMLKDFAYLGEEDAHRVVIENTNKIADLVDVIRPVPAGNFPPSIPGAEEELQRICWESTKELYGDPVPEYVAQRLEKELNSIIKHGFAVLYIIAQKLVKDSEDHGYHVGSRGSVGSSFVATAAGISEVNPLAPHYRCPKCKHTEFFLNGEVGSGYDLPPKDCPECGTPMHRDGHNIPFETFLGFKGDKSPDIDLNFSGEWQANAHRYTIELFGEDHVFKAGTISTIKDKTAFGFAKKYFDSIGKVTNSAETDMYVEGCVGVKRTTGQHAGGMIVVPNDYDIYDFTAVQYPADDKDKGMTTTHFDFNFLHDTILKLDNLGHDVPSFYKYLEDMTGIPVNEVDVCDPKIYDLFTSPAPLGITPEDINGCETGTLSIPEMGTPFVRGMLVECRPKNFSDLLQISGLSHGTDVWLGNAQELIKNGTCTISNVIGTRDGIMLTLMGYGLSSDSAFRIMEFVRKNKKGKPLPEEMVEDMKAHNVPQWYIDSCFKIKYMFPKAHAAAYVMAALRLAWYKLYRPLEFYATYFTVRGEDIDATALLSSPSDIVARIAVINAKPDLNKKDQDMITCLQVALEMKARGIELLPVDLYKSKATVYTIEDGKIRLAFNSIKGLGDAAATALEKAKDDGDGPYTSVEDIQNRSGISSAVVTGLRELGALQGIPESSQISLFG